MRLPFRAVCLAATFAGATAFARDALPDARVRADPLSVYTVCVTAAYAELIARYPNPAESLVRARMACKEQRSALEADVRRSAGSSTPEVLLAIDAEILKSLRE